VPVADCVAANGTVTHRATGRVLSYGKLAADAAKITLEAEPAIKKLGEFTLIGKSLPRLDTPVKLDGSAKYGIDTRLPDMVYAAVMSSPVFGGKLVSVDEAPIRGQRGILRVVRMPDAVAVVADSYWRAQKALNALKPVWDGGAAASTNSAQFRQLYRDTLDGPMAEAEKEGDAEAALAGAGRVYEALYEAPHLAHVTMEPLNATVQLKADRLDVWIGTQSALNCLRSAATSSGLRPEQVFIHGTYLGGGFGRRSRNDEMIHAINVAKAVGDRPVKLVWSREQDMRSDRYRPQAAVKMRASLAPDGTIAAMASRIAVGSISRSTQGPQAAPNGVENQAIDGFDDIPYKIPNYHVGVALKNTHVPVSFWRSVGGSQNCFFFESFIDELAHAAGKDPLEFRRAMMERKDFIGVIDTLKEKSNWGTPLRAGRGRGVAICENHGSIIGQVAEVTVDNAGNVKVDRIVAAVDCYQAVNPRIIETQIEGGIMMGLTAAFYGEITIKDGAVVEGNFDTHKMLTLADAPQVEVYLSLTGGGRFAGVGECGLAPTAPAVTNAIFAATKKRVRELPLKNVKLSELASL
jgi:isoquinoline 1-oxidoreductase beta subunit